MKTPDLATGVVHPAIERLAAGVGEVDVAVNLVVERRAIDAVGGVVDAQAVDQHGRAVRTEGVVRLPDFQVPDDVRVTRVGRGPIERLDLVEHLLIADNVVGLLAPPLQAMTIPAPWSQWDSLSSKRQLAIVRTSTGFGSCHRAS